MGRLYRLPPAGSPVPLRADGEAMPEGIWGHYRPRYFASGTEALAAGLIAARQRLPGRDSVVVPAFACPALVAAARAARCRVIAVDLVEDRPWMDLAALARHVDERSVAVVAVDLCGIPERYREIRAIAAPRGAVVIQDAAQWFPMEGDHGGWHGDQVVVSFGRGKPVSLMEGGALLQREGPPGTADPPPRVTPFDSVRFSARAIAYRLMIHPRLFSLAAALPFLHVGETRYRACPQPRAISGAALQRLATAVAHYRRRDRQTERALARIVAQGPLLDLAAICGATNPLNRYPLLLPDEGWRAELLQRLGDYGLSPLYPGSLAEIPGTGIEGSYPHASRFARRLLTLPTHPGVDEGALAAIAEVVAPGGIGLGEFATKGEQP